MGTKNVMWLILSVLVVAACSSQPDGDIEATVEARVQQETEKKPTAVPTSTSQQASKLVPTLIPTKTLTLTPIREPMVTPSPSQTATDIPTSTPLSPTPMSTSLPTPTLTVFPLPIVDTPNPDLNKTSAGMLNAVLTNRNPDCRAYAMDANSGNYSSVGADDRSNFAPSAPFSPGTGVTSSVTIDLVIVAGNYIHDPSNPKTPGGWNYESVTETTNPELATHCRMIHNMIPNHDFGWHVGKPYQPNVWVTWIDHSDWQVTYIPVHPQLSDPLVADDTRKNPTNFMDYDGILLNGIGIAMDSGFCYNPGHSSVNTAGNATGCGGKSVWYEIPAYALHDQTSENMSGIFDEYWGHGFEGSYHYHAITHPLQKDDDQTVGPSGGSPLIGYGKDGFPIYGHWFVNQAGELVKAESGYVLKTYKLNGGKSRDPIVGLPPRFNRGTPPTPWDIENRPEDFETDFGLPLGRYIEDWVYEGDSTGNLDECNGATDINGVYGYYVTDKYPFGPICSFGVHEPSFGKVPPLRWNDESEDNNKDSNGVLINGH